MHLFSPVKLLYTHGQTEQNPTLHLEFMMSEELSAILIDKSQSVLYDYLAHFELAKDHHLSLIINQACAFS